MGNILEAEKAAAVNALTHTADFSRWGPEIQIEIGKRSIRGRSGALFCHDCGILLTRRR